MKDFERGDTGYIYTAQMYVSGGYQMPLTEPMPVGTPYMKLWDGHINFLLPSYNNFTKVSIPQRGVLRSYNVSAAMNIIVWDYLRQTLL
jgi:hypothetical protein